MKGDIDHKAKEQAEKQILLRRISPCHKTGQLYSDKKAYIENLSTFVKDGLKTGDSIIVIATSVHLAALGDKLRADGVDLFQLTLSNQYIPLDADILLEKFIVAGWPDEMLFRHLVMTLASRALKNDRNVRAYSEMAAILWLKGDRAASVQLQQIWDKLIQTTTEYDYVRLTNEILSLPPDGELS